jgi:hypothetical protein
MTLAMGLSFGMPKVFAVDVIGNVCKQQTATGSAPQVCQDNQASASDSSNPLFGPDGVLTKAVQIILVILGIVAIFVLIVNGVRLMTSGGDPSSVNSARNGIIYAVVGVVIAISAQLIVTFLLSKIGN